MVLKLDKVLELNKTLEWYPDWQWTIVYSLAIRNGTRLKLGLNVKGWSEDKIYS